MKILKNIINYDFFYDYENDTFACPLGVKLIKENEYKYGSVKYCNKEGCSECPNESKLKYRTQKYRIIIDKKKQFIKRE
jgi:hypothetical protein